MGPASRYICAMFCSYSAVLVCLMVAIPQQLRAERNWTSFTNQPAKATTDRYASWLARVPDDALLSELSLAGTHDTCARFNGFSLGFAQCQTWELPDQLKAGIRFLDIRCRHLNDDFHIYHGIIDQRTTFKSVRDTCKEFLKQHPSEFIVMSIKSESTPKRNTRSFAATFTELTKDDEELWYRSQQIPRLKEVRGRIVLVDRVGALKGYPWKKAKRQDEYQAPLDKKAEFVEAHFKAALQADKNVWFVNYCSGTLPSKLITPRLYAQRSNEFVFKFLDGAPVRPLRLGTVLMDFPSEEVIAEIIETNFARKKSDKSE